MKKLYAQSLILKMHRAGKFTIKMKNYVVKRNKLFDFNKLN